MRAKQLSVVSFLMIWMTGRLITGCDQVINDRTLVPQLIETFSLSQLFGVNPVMYFC